MRLRARRSFYSDGRIPGKRRIIQRGEFFETDDNHAQQLIRRRIAQEAAVYIQQTVTPTETPTAASFLVEPIREPENTQEAAPAELKAEGLPYGLEEPAEQQEQTEPLPAAEPLEELPYNDLKERAKAAGIKGYNRMKKFELIEKLKGERKNGRG